jgi:hypothetical protein
MKTLLGSEKQIAWATDIITKAEGAWKEAIGLVKPEMQGKLAAFEAAYWAKVEKRCTRDGKVYAEEVIANKLYFPESADQLKTNMSHFCSC